MKIKEMLGTQYREINNKIVFECWVPCLPNGNTHTVINCLNKVNETLHLLIFPLWKYLWSCLFSTVPLEGAQIAVLLGLYKSSFLGFLAFMQLGVGLILTFLLTLPGLFVCLFVFPLSLYLELLQAGRLAEWVSSSSWCYFNGIRQHSTNSLTALLLTSWPYMTYHTTNMTPALNNSFQVIKIDVVESGNPGPLQGKQTCSTLFTLSSTLSQN